MGQLRTEGKYDATGGPTACWPWRGWVARNGYGVATDGRKLITSAHRAVYLCLVGPIPEGQDLDHLCRNRRCVNPAHLEPVTRGENIRRGLPFGGKRVWNGCLPPAGSRKYSDLCKRGHPLDGVRTRGKGGRYCRECINVNRRERLARAAK